MSKALNAKRGEDSQQRLVRQIAYHIANDLFTSGGGSGRRAARLVLEYAEGGNGGGWCFKAAMARIEKHLLPNRVISHNSQSKDKLK